MASWVEDIIQALENLGGQATLNQIYAEIRRIRRNLPDTYDAAIRERIEFHSSDSDSFHKRNGDPQKDYFRKVGKGTWALRGKEHTNSLKPVEQVRPHRKPIQQVISPASKPQPPSDSFEIISNTFRTIKEYRDYSNPDTPSWQTYIREIFHLLGFSTEEQDERHFILKNMGSHHNLALVVYIQPNEDFEYAVPGLRWESHLRYAANFHQINWGILTNGLQLKAFNYNDPKNQLQFFYPNLDEIIEHEKLIDFFPIYKVFSLINEQNNNETQPQKNRLDLRLEFWRQLLEQTKTDLPLFANISPGTENWISTGAGKTGFGYAFVIRMTDAQIELYIDQGNEKQNKQYFDTLHARKEHIEKAFGDSLDWQRLNEKRACRVRYVIEDAGLQNRDKWPELQKRMIESMKGFERVFRPEIRMLK